MHVDPAFPPPPGQSDADRAGSPTLEQRPGLKLVLFDFDQTLSTIHLYHRLDEEMTEDPYAGEGTDDSKMHRHGAIQLETFRRSFANQNQLLDAFGGADRVAAVQKMLRDLKACGVLLAIVSHGFTEVVRTAMARVECDELFDKIIGFDHPTAQANEGHKFRVVAALRAELGGVSSDDTILVDDDYRNLTPCKQTRSCGTMWIWSRQGMDEMQMDRLRCAAAKTGGDAAFDIATARRVDPNSAAAGDHYYLLPAYDDLAKVVEVANKVPVWRRIEGVCVVHADMGGQSGREYYVIHASYPDALRYDQMLRFLRLPTPPPPTRPREGSFADMSERSESPSAAAALRLPRGAGGSACVSAEASPAVERDHLREVGGEVGGEQSGGEGGEEESGGEEAGAAEAPAPAAAAAAGEAAQPKRRRRRDGGGGDADAAFVDGEAVPLAPRDPSSPGGGDDWRDAIVAAVDAAGADGAVQCRGVGELGCFAVAAASVWLPARTSAGAQRWQLSALRTRRGDGGAAELIAEFRPA